MSERPWFKAYAADILTDEKLDALPPECLGLVLKIWCVCHIEGKCPSEAKELARKTRLSIAYVLQYKSQCESLFESLDGFYVSARMEREKKRSEINRDNANERYKQKTSTIRTANSNVNGTANRSQTSDSDYNSGVDVDLIDGQVHEIASLYPRINDAFHLPTDIAYAIAEAVARDGRDMVWMGTKSVSDVAADWPPSELKYLPSAQKFFRESSYRNPPEFWQRNGNGQTSKAAARADRSKQNIFEGITADAGRRAPSDSTERKDGTGSGTGLRVQPRAVGGTA